MNRSTLLSIYRTDHQKFVTYQGDGSGRDTHIVFGDGGLIPEPYRKGSVGFKPFEPTSSRPVTMPASQRLAPSFQNVYYPPDGTGRDSYIIKNNGGTCNQDFATSGINF